MRNALLVAALAAVAIAPCFAQRPRPDGAEFQPFYADFLKAVRANDREKLADMISFPVKDWSMLRNRNVTTGSIKDRGDFLARYNSLFTASMRAHVPRAKLEMLKDGRYLLSWHDVDTEYGFDFDYVAGAGYRLLSYSIGPY
jgi:hypothetical protein